MQTSRRKQRGAVMVEMALILPVLIILVFGIIQFGLALNRYQAFQAAAREGARVGSLENTTGGQIDQAVTDALTGIPGPAPAVAISPQTCFGRIGEKITVTVSGPYTIQIPLLPDADVDLTGTGVFRCEG